MNPSLTQYLVFILDEPSAFYAEEIYDAVSGEGTNDQKLMQIFLQRAEVLRVSTSAKLFR
jgi:hypothetical protein